MLNYVNAFAAQDRNVARIINLTPHALNFVGEDGQIVLTVEPSGTLARVSSKTILTGEIMGIPVTSTEYGEVEGLPAPEEGTVYVVSSLVASRVPERGDVFIPNESVRDEKGRIIGCRSLGHV